MNLRLRNIYLLLGICLLFSFGNGPNSNLKSQDNDYVYWSQRKLEWSDFQGKIPSESKFHALTHSAISLDFQSEGVILEFKIEAIFDPSKSWKKEGVDKYILNHEQRHFDITEYHSRLLRKKLKTTKYSSIEAINDEVKNIFNEAFDKANEMQIKYDSETEHSVNKKKQKKWDKKITKYLKSTSAYKNPKVKVNVSYLTN